jgi:hypothetical protein
MGVAQQILAAESGVPLVQGTITIGTSGSSTGFGAGFGSKSLSLDTDTLTVLSYNSTGTITNVTFTSAPPTTAPLFVIFGTTAAFISNHTATNWQASGDIFNIGSQAGTVNVSITQ